MIEILRQVIEAEHKFFRVAMDCTHLNPLINIKDTSNSETYHGCRHPGVNEIATCRPDRCPWRGKVF
jgi:hypothetical protein